MTLPATVLRALSLATAAVLLAVPARAGEVFSKPPSPAGGVNTSCWVAPDGSDSDMYAWDDFTLPVTQTITEVRWRGGYSYGAPYGKVADFRVSVFASIAGGFQPVITVLPEDEENEVTLLSFHTQGNAGETPVGSVGGIALYDYHATLPTPFVATAGVKYWLRVVGEQPVYPDWGLASGTGGDGSYFRYSTGMHMFQYVPHDLAFSLHATWVDLGQGLAGASGVPQLAGTGSLDAGSACTLALAGARPLAPVTLVFGTTVLGAPFKGGQLVPSPLLLVALASDAAGKLSLPFSMPAGLPPGTSLVFQGWVADPAGPKGLAASNGLSATTP